MTDETTRKPYIHHEYVRKMVDQAPPLTEATKAALRELLRPMRESLNGNADKPTGEWVKPFAPSTTPRRTALYRHYDADGCLLYVGITDALEIRTRAHGRRSVWREFAHRAEVIWFDTRDEALAAEREAISTEQPLFNVQLATPEAQRAVVAYLVKRDRLDLLALA